jgi:adenylosuccinate lyase
MEYIDAIRKDKSISSQITEKEIKAIFTPENHLGSSSSIINNVSKSVQNTCKKFI